MKLKNNTPIGTEKHRVMATFKGPRGLYCEPRLIDRPVFNEEDKAFAKEMRTLRVKTGHTLGEVARHFGLSVVEVSAIDMGEKRPATPEDEAEYRRVISDVNAVKK